MIFVVNPLLPFIGSSRSTYVRILTYYAGLHSLLCSLLVTLDRYPPVSSLHVFVLCIAYSQSSTNIRQPDKPYIKNSDGLSHFLHYNSTLKNYSIPRESVLRTEEKEGGKKRESLDDYQTQFLHSHVLVFKEYCARVMKNVILNSLK